MADPKTPIDLERMMADDRRAQQFRREHPQVFVKTVSDRPDLGREQFFWRPIETAPKRGMILVYGQPKDTEDLRFTGPGIHAAYWDEIDQAYCLDGGTWLGPFIAPTHWMPLPEPPK